MTRHHKFKKQKKKQLWPRLKKICDEETRKGYVDFEELVKTRINYRNKLRHFLTQMSEKHYYNYDVYQNIYGPCCIQPSCLSCTNYTNIDEEDFNLLLNEMTHALSHYFLIDELENLLGQSQCGRKDELTNIFYGKKLIPYLKHYQLENVWQEFMRRPAAQQLVEEVATFVAQWCLPEEHISYSHVETILDNIVQQVMNYLESENPIHPIFSISHEQFLFWKYNKINENHWNNDDGRYILDILCKVLSQLNFHGVTYCGNTTFREPVLINYVLEKKVGYIVLLTIVFQSVARRLGIRCDVIFSPSYCFLSWKPNYNITNPDDKQCIYIDIFLNGTFVIDNNQRIREAASASIQNCDTCDINKSGVNFMELILKLAKYINRCTHQLITPEDEAILIGCWEIKHLMKPDDVDIIQNLAGWYEKQGRSLAHLITALEKIDRSSEDLIAHRAESFLHEFTWHEKARSCKCGERREPKRREAGLIFAVGMIVRVYDISSIKIDVICGWVKGEEESNRSRLNLQRLSGWHYAVLCGDETFIDAYQGVNGCQRFIMMQHHLSTLSITN